MDFKQDLAKQFFVIFFSGTGDTGKQCRSQNQNPSQKFCCSVHFLSLTK